ncbi:hypothetical protein HN014_10690 [Aquimarina sp. TRL1]|nr:hypothetical protein HN014_10690 [Aquimarina sp. TRL1]
MDHNDELMRYQDDAEDRFDNYGNMQPYEDQEDDFDGDVDMEEQYDDFDEEVDDDDFEDQHYDSYSRVRYGRIDANDRTLTITVVNTTDEAKTAIIFGANQDLPQPDGVTVEVQESSHKEVKEESKSNPFKIVGLKYSVSDALQFDNVLKIINKTASGTITTRVWQPRNSSSPQNFDPKMVDSGGFSMNVSGQSSIQFLINAGATAVFTFTVRARTNISNLLEGRHVAELSRTPRTTGLPQLDNPMARYRYPSKRGGRGKSVKSLKRAASHLKRRR